MTTQAKHRVANLRLAEISSVDNPAQVGARVVLIKRGEGPDVEIRKSAASVVEGGKADYTTLQYEDAMLRRAEELGREQGVSPEQALAKNLSSDMEMKALAFACEVARVDAYGVGIRKRYGG